MAPRAKIGGGRGKGKGGMGGGKSGAKRFTNNSRLFKVAATVFGCCDASNKGGCSPSRSQATGVGSKEARGFFGDGMTP